MPSSCALFGGFAISARVSLLSQHSGKPEMSASACARSMSGFINININTNVLVHVNLQGTGNYY